MAIVPGKGTLLKLGSTTIAQRVTISGPSRSVGSVETTHLDSATKTYRPTILDNGELSLEIEYDPDDATHTSLEDLMATPEIESWVLEFANGTTYTFDGFLTGFEPNGMEVEGKLLASLTIKLSGGLTKGGGS